MEQVKAIVLRAAGINCDAETAFALQSAGAQADLNTGHGDRGRGNQRASVHVWAVGRVNAIAVVTNRG